MSAKTLENLNRLHGEEGKMKEMTIRIHEIAVDGLPDKDRLVGRIAFLHDGEILSGWPITGTDLWESAESYMGGTYAGVTHWIEFPIPLVLIPLGRESAAGSDDSTDDAQLDILPGSAEEL